MKDGNGSLWVRRRKERSAIGLFVFSTGGGAPGMLALCFWPEQRRRGLWIFLRGGSFRVLDILIAFCEGRLIRLWETRRPDGGTPGKCDGIRVMFLEGLFIGHGLSDCS